MGVATRFACLHGALTTVAGVMSRAAAFACCETVKSMRK